MPRFRLGDAVDSAVDFLQRHLSWLFDAIGSVVSGMYDGIDAVLSAPEPLLLAGILAVLAWWLRSLVAGVLAFAGFALIDSVELWDDAMATLSLVLVATSGPGSRTIPAWPSDGPRSPALQRGSNQGPRRALS